jgi:hypothetical protein
MFSRKFLKFRFEVRDYCGSGRFPAAQINVVVFNLEYPVYGNIGGGVWRTNVARVVRLL